MSYTVVVDGVPILCETASAAIALAREAASSGASVSTSPGSPRPADQVLVSGSRWTEQRVRDFFRFIKPQQRKLIDALLDTADARTDEQLCQLLSVADGRALAGVFTGLFKNAKKVGANPRDVYVRHPVTIDGRRQFEYTLAESFRAAARKWRSSPSSGKCPTPDCGVDLIHHDNFGVQSADPLKPTILRNVYECPQHGFFEYLGDSKFRRLEELYT